MALFKNLPFTGRSNHGHNTTGLKNTPIRVHKQDVVSNKMFGSKRKNIQIGKTFRRGKKDNMKAPKMEGEKHSSISPSVAEFDKMMSGITKKASSKSKMFNKRG